MFLRSVLHARNVMIAGLGLVSLFCSSQDSLTLKVHFLYGSKPLKEFKDSEQKWFGGILGGHVGLEMDNGAILNFVPSGKLHVIDKPNKMHSTFAVHSEENFYAILGGQPDSVKKLVISIPVSWEQKQRFDSISAAYLKQTPYDYAVIGMRCGASTYEILAQLGIVKEYSYSKTYKKILYPKILRKELIELAKENNWPMEKQEGSGKRQWETD